MKIMNICRHIVNIVTAVNLLCTVSILNAGDLNTEPLTQDVQVSIETNTTLAVASFSKLSGYNFDYSKKSIEWLNGFIERNSTEEPGTLVDVVGSYLGEAIVKTYNGKWVLFNGVPAVELGENLVVFPLSKVEKHFVNGPEDSVLAFYNAIPELKSEWSAKNASNQ